MRRDKLATVRWFKSSYSNAERACVEVAVLDGGDVAVRDTKHQGHGPVMILDPAEWGAFIAGARSGEFIR